MYFKAIYRTILTMGSFYVENTVLWIKSAMWDAPRRVVLDVQLEQMAIEREEYFLSGRVTDKKTNE
jgi:hypothetical protein